MKVSIPPYNSSSEWLTLIGPAKQLSEGRVEVGDESGDLFMQIIQRSEVSPTQDFAR